MWGWRGLAAFAALLGFLAVLLGAVGSHAIDLADGAAERRWNIALQLHFFQAAALLALAACVAAVQSPQTEADANGKRIGLAPFGRLPTWMTIAGWVQAAGILLFSGSLYLRAAQLEVLPGWVTPSGGLVLLAGWLLLVLVLVVKPR